MCAQLRCTLCGQEDQQAQPVSIHQRCSLLCKVAPPLMYERTAGWLTSRHTLIWTHTHTHTRSRKKTNRHIVHSYSYGHTHTHSILLLFTLLLLYIHVTHMKFFSHSRSFSPNLFKTHTHTWNTHLLSDLLECHSIFITAIPSDLLLTSELWLM